VSESGDHLLANGKVVPFGEVVAALAHRSDSGSTTQSRALSATIVAVGPDDLLSEAADALRGLGSHTAVRGILISPGAESRPVPRLADDIVALSGLKPAFINNAVAALRLSSLPTIVWWRGGRTEMIAGLARLADRVVLEGAPLEVWPHAESLFDEAAFSDLRWTRLTRWRTLMAHFFDVPEVRDAAPGFDRLRITGADGIAASLFAAWLAGSLGRAEKIELEFVHATRGAFMEEVVFSGQGEHEALVLRLARSTACVLTTATVRGHRGATSAVALGNQSLAALMTEELRVRARDSAFEAAVRRFLGRS